MAIGSNRNHGMLAQFQIFLSALLDQASVELNHLEEGLALLLTLTSGDELSHQADALHITVV
jgi:hypothetical protein